LDGASVADKAMWNEMQENWERFAVESQQAVSQLTKHDDPTVSINSEATISLPNYEGADRQITSTARVGQAFFRRAVLSAYQYRCCITGISIPQLLVASHIVPWRNDAANRLNPKNGLCLSALHDKAFDGGIICITENFTVRVSNKHRPANDRFFDATIYAFEGSKIMLPEKFQPDREFLDYHRKHIFEAQIADNQ
jgi:putative restriction endonuclease